MERVRDCVEVDDECNGSGVRVAVVDTGIDLTHPDFGDAVDQASSKSFTFDGRLVDTHGHGTHVAGIIAGSGRGNPKYRGVAPGVELIVCKIASTWCGSSSQIIAAIEHAVSEGADLINLSLGEYLGQAGGPGPWVWPRERSPVEIAVQWALEQGALCICAAGNAGPYTGSVEPPGTVPGAVSVGAFGWDGIVTEGSARGPFYRSDLVDIGQVLRMEEHPGEPQEEEAIKPDLVAPGGEFSSVFARRDIYGQIQIDPGGVVAPLAAASGRRPMSHLDADLRYTRLGGTSQATGVVTGLAALALQWSRREGLEWGGDRPQALAHLLRAAAAREAVESVNAYGNGRLAWPAIREKIGACVADEDMRHHILGGGQLKLM